jgi:hypothetical protein
MRKRFEVQYELGATPIEKITMSQKSRDEMPAVLRALQHIYTTPELNGKVFDMLEHKIISSHNNRTGRLGMSLWEILVFAVVRQARDMDYDHLHYIANYDSLVRKMLGISDFGENLKEYSLQSIKDNVTLLDEKILDEINELVVKTGHGLKKNEKLNVHVDTYVLETCVHFPTDLNLLWDASRKSIELVCHIIKDADEKTGWRKHHIWRKKLKFAYHIAAKNTVGAGRHKSKGIEAALTYLTIASALSRKLKKSKDILEKIANKSFYKIIKFTELQYFEEHLDKHIDLVRRRLIFGEKIPHEEKVFSLFEPHTRWIKKGKAGNKVELGLPIAIATDQYRFILRHHVLQEEQDIDIAVPFAEELVKRYDIASMSFDKSFWSPKNYKDLNQLVEQVISPKKGKLNKQEYEREHAKQFKALRAKHAAVESDINCLEHHGLNRCPDKGIGHFKRYTSLGVLAYNLHKLGNILLERDRKWLSKNKKILIAA